MDALDPREELFGLINFDGAKVVQVEGELLEVDRPNIIYMLCTFHGGNTCFSDIVNLEFVKNLKRGSNLVLFQKLSVSSSMTRRTTSSQCRAVELRAT